METPKASWQENITGEFRNIVWCGWGAKSGVRKGEGKAKHSEVLAGCMDSPSKRDTKGQGRMWKTFCVSAVCCSMF